MNQTVAVVGLGKSHMALIRWLIRQGARVAAFDQATPDRLGDRYRALQQLGVTRLSLGPDYLRPLPEYQTIFLTPGMPKYLPEIQAARAAGAELSGEIPLVLRLCRAKVVGITGSAGKTTTTTVVGEILRAAGLQVHVGGNIGTPLIETVETIPETAVVVLELSSFQLQLADRSPQVAVVTNLSPNHLDIHADMAEYVEAKRNIFRFQGETGRVVLNADNAITRAMAEATGDRTVWFSLNGDPGGRAAAFLEGDDLVWRIGQHRVPTLKRSEIKLPGRHNIENILAAMAAAYLAGGSLHGVRTVVPEFTGVEHRLEPVRILEGVRYINDSKATSPVETLAALGALPDPLVLICGGYDKRIPFDELGAALVGSQVHTLVLTGATSAAIIQAVEQAAVQTGRPAPRLVGTATMAEAVAQARSAARPGDVVVLSPACASYDQYRNFEERGRHFKDLVHALA